MTVCEFLEFVAEMRNLKNPREAALAMRETCALSGVWHQTIETLSKGYKQRVGFAQALIHDPAVLVLDEPTDGLDPNQKHEVRELIKRMGKDKTIILSTHILEEVEAICERVIIIAKGKIVADGKVSDLISQSENHNSVTIRLKAGSGKLHEAKSLLGGLATVARTDDLGDAQTLRCFPRDKATIITDIVQLMNTHQIDIEHIAVEKGRFDEVFRKITKQAAKEISHETV
jgi:ABC-2 type transport system ATP-binding protein